MKLTTVIIFFFINLYACLATSDTRLDRQWRAYKTKFGKSYTLYEDQYRKSVWLRRRRKIHKHNMEAKAGLHSYKKGQNQFTDQTENDALMKRDCLSSNLLSESKNIISVNFTCTDSLPESVDWRRQNLLGPVEDQGNCGACYAFAALGGLEFHIAKATGQLVLLSKQEVVDCSKGNGNSGCKSGYPGYVYDYIIAKRAIDTEYYYPYTGNETTCKTHSSFPINLRKYYDTDQGTEKELQAIVANQGAVFVGILICQDDFSDYSSGIYTGGHCTKRGGHAVLAVGYGTENDMDYWIIKNSWGTSWGEQGYGRIQRNVGMCGIGSAYTVPIF